MILTEVNDETGLLSDSEADLGSGADDPGSPGAPDDSAAGSIGDGGAAALMVLMGAEDTAGDAPADGGADGGDDSSAAIDLGPMVCPIDTGRLAPIGWIAPGDSADAAQDAGTDVWIDPDAVWDGTSGDLIAIDEPWSGDPGFDGGDMITIDDGALIMIDWMPTEQWTDAVDDSGEDDSGEDDSGAGVVSDGAGSDATDSGDAGGDAGTGDGTDDGGLPDAAVDPIYSTDGLEIGPIVCIFLPEAIML